MLTLFIPLFRILKHKVYENRPNEIEELKESIRAMIRQIPMEMLSSEIDSARQCAQDCLQHNGTHLLDVIFKT